MINRYLLSCLLSILPFLSFYCYAEPSNLKPNGSCSYLLKKAADQLSSGQFESSLSIFNSILTDQSYSADCKCEAFWGRGQIKEAGNDLNGAIDDFGSALQCRADSKKYKDALGDAFLKRGDLKERLGNTKGAIGDYEKALSYSDIKKARSNLSSIYYKKGLLCEKDGDLACASENYRSALRLNPENRSASEALIKAEELKENKKKQKESFITF